MSDYYETDGACRRCLRSSPMASFMGLILVFLGAGAFGVGGFYSYTFIKDMLPEDTLPFVDYTIYGLAGATGGFVIIAYIVCALSSGTNARRLNNTRGQTLCCLCCNMTLILSILFGIMLWIGILCLTGYTLMSVAFVTHRQITMGNADKVMMSKVFDAQETTTVGDSLLRARRQEPSLLSNVPLSGDGSNIDLSYFGVFKGGQPATVESQKYNDVKEKLILSISAMATGILVMLFGYLIILACAAMNYARLQESRYYDIDTNCYADERAPLRQ